MHTPAEAKETAEAQDTASRPEVDLVHLRNVGYGCYNFAVRATG
jgi:hypothetical protein